MEETKEQQEVREEEEGEDISPLDEARNLVKEMKAQNEALRSQLERAERVAANNLVSGQAEAGAPSVNKEEKEIEAARSLLKGTGFEDQLFPSK